MAAWLSIELVGRVRTGRPPPVFRLVLPARAIVPGALGLAGLAASLSREVVALACFGLARAVARVSSYAAASAVEVARLVRLVRILLVACSYRIQFVLDVLTLEPSAKR